MEELCLLSWHLTLLDDEDIDKADDTLSGCLDHFSDSLHPPLRLSLSLFNSISIQRALLAWETHVNIAKASEIDNRLKLNKLT